MQQASFYCPQCQRPKLFTAKSVNHILHLLLFLFLCGMWLPVWLLVTIAHVPQYYCSDCGYTSLLRYLQNPGLRAQEEADRRRRAQQGAAVSGDITSHPWFWPGLCIIVGSILLSIIISLFSTELSRPAPARPVVVTTPSPTPSLSSAQILEKAQQNKNPKFDSALYLLMQEVSPEDQNYKKIQKLMEIELRKPRP